jgi:NAD(P)-dependent dehydrogenase (short-subunit alcohol dehydrogenase family)
MAERLAGKVALVTGGASGIGEAACRLFVRAGARGVVIADVTDAAGRALAAGLASPASSVLFQHLDVSQEAQWAAAIRAVMDHFGQLDVLVNNAGISVVSSGMPSVEGTTEESWERVFGVNAKGVFLGMKHAIPAMRQSGGGSIVNIASVYAMVGSPLGTAYSASKGAVRAVTRTAAVQYAPQGIRVNAVFPGFVDSPMTRELHARPGVRESRLGQTPLGRLATPENIAWGILFLASDESSYMTGSELVIDGGLTAR